HRLPWLVRPSSAVRPAVAVLLSLLPECWSAPPRAVELALAQWRPRCPRPERLLAGRLGALLVAARVPGVKRSASGASDAEQSVERRPVGRAARPQRGSAAARARTRGGGGSEPGRTTCNGPSVRPGRPGAPCPGGRGNPVRSAGQTEHPEPAGPWSAAGYPAGGARS